MSSRLAGGPTERQAEALRLWRETGSKAEVAKLLGVSERNTHALIKRAERRERLVEAQPEGLTAVLDAMQLQGAHSAWIKTDNASVYVKAPVLADDPLAVLDAIREGLTDLRAEPRMTLALTEDHSTGLMGLFPIADLHFGLHTDAREVGEGWNIEKAKRVFAETFQNLVDVTPAGDVAVLAQLGDLLHANDHRNVTPGHEHRLDVDGRLYQAIRAAVSAMKGAIESLRRKYPRVIYHGLPGNHDETVQVGVTVALSEFYSDCPDVEIVENEARIHKREWGRNLIVFHHGDRVKPDQMPQFAAAEWAAEWGRTDYRLALSGHIHTPSMKPRGGMDCETVGTIIPRDGYAWSNGYSGRRELVSITVKEAGGWVTRGRMPAAHVEG